MQPQRETHASKDDKKLHKRKSWKSTYSNGKIDRINLKILLQGSHKRSPIFKQMNKKLG